MHLKNGALFAPHAKLDLAVLSPNSLFFGVWCRIGQPYPKSRGHQLMVHLSVPVLIMPSVITQSISNASWDRISPSLSARCSSFNLRPRTLSKCWRIFRCSADKALFIGVIFAQQRFFFVRYNYSTSI